MGSNPIGGSMKQVEPQVFLIGETAVVSDGFDAYLNHLGIPEWGTDATTPGEYLTEFYGRLCYRSFEPGLNPNVTRIRHGNRAYIANVIKQEHGSVLEHATLNFVLADVSRVFTHELVRHRVGTAISQESLRYVRLDNLSFWLPQVFRAKPDAVELAMKLIDQLESAQIQLAAMFGLDDETVPFAVKKAVTSAMRRLAPDGLATTIGWSVNFRALHNIIGLRTAPGAEEEMRLVFGKIAETVIARYPAVFGDFTFEIVDGYAWYTSPHPKI